MKTNTKTLLKAIKSADLLVIEDSPYLGRKNISISDSIGDPDNEAIYAQWSDDEGLKFAIKFTESGLENAKIYNHHIIVEDSEGDFLTIRFFTVTPMNVL